MRPRARWLLLAALLLAQPASGDDRPWSRGVSAEQQARAKELLAEGNELLLNDKHREALAKYQEAIAAWDHPGIRFNIVRVLIALDRPLDAYENLEKALAYGKAPHDESLYAEAINYKTLLEGQLATIEVSCTQSGVDVSLDGAAFLSCPGKKRVRTTPGNHALIGAKRDYLTSTRSLLVLPGKATSLDVTLRSYAEAAVTRTRWATWKPWAVAITGAAFVGIGALLRARAQSGLQDYERDVANTCGDEGCRPGDPTWELLQDEESAALRDNKIAIGMFAAGAAGIGAGIVLVVLNRTRSYVPDMERVSVKPVLAPDVAGATVVIRY